MFVITKTGLIKNVKLNGGPLSLCYYEFETPALVGLIFSLI
jgi:hypothetical protein